MGNGTYLAKELVELLFWVFDCNYLNRQINRCIRCITNYVSPLLSTLSRKRNDNVNSGMGACVNSSLLSVSKF